MDIIRELWCGNVAPFEQCTRGDKQMKELLSLMARNRDELGDQCGPGSEHECPLSQNGDPFC